MAGRIPRNAKFPKSYEIQAVSNTLASSRSGPTHPETHWRPDLMGLVGYDQCLFHPGICSSDHLARDHDHRDRLEYRIWRQTMKSRAELMDTLNEYLDDLVELEAEWRRGRDTRVFQRRARKSRRRHSFYYHASLELGLLPWNEYWRRKANIHCRINQLRQRLWFWN